MYGVSGSVGPTWLASTDRRVGQRLVPPGIASARPGHRAGAITQPAHDEHLAHGGRLGDRRVGRLLEADRGAAAQEAVGGDEDRRLGVAQPRRHGGRAVAGEDRRVDGLEQAKGEDRDRRLGEQRQQDPDAVARPHPASGEHRRRPLDGGAELGIGEAAHLAVVALPRQRGAVRLTGQPRLQGRGGVVERTPAPPPGELDAAVQVQHGPRAALPGQRQVVRGRAPEPAGVVDRVPLQGGQVGVAGRAQEARQPGVGQVGRAGTPRHVGSITPEDGPVGKGDR